MAAEDNVATYRRWFHEGCSQGNLDLVDELYSREYVTHSLPPDLPPTREGLKTFIRALRGGEAPALTRSFNDFWCCQQPGCLAELMGALAKSADLELRTHRDGRYPHYDGVRHAVSASLSDPPEHHVQSAR